MDIETRITNLEKLVDSLVTTINNTKFYTDADIAGCRNTDIELSDQIEAVTPYEATKTVSYGDTEIMFENVPQGNLTVLVKDSEGNYPVHHATRKDDVVKVEFAPLEYAADVTITIQ